MFIPHMSNLPWMMTYSSIFIFLFYLLSYKYNDYTTNYSNLDNKTTSKNQWTW